MLPLRSLFSPLSLFDSFPFQRFDERRSPVRVTEHEKDVVFQLDVPGFAPQDVQLTVNLDTGVITFAGKRDGSRLHRTASFNHSFSLPLDEFDLAAAVTSVEHGVASITVPKRPPQPAIADAANTKVAVIGSGGVVGPHTGAYDAAAKMRWPPKFRVVDSDPNVLVYSCDLPVEIAPDNIEVHLDHGALIVSVRAVVETQKKDDKGNVTYQSSRTLNYSTPLGVPRGTQPEDVSVGLDKGELKITVKNRAKPAAINGPAH